MKWYIDPTKLFIYNKIVCKQINLPPYQQTTYSLNGHYHNPNGPAFINSITGKQWTTAYYINGVRHRLDGPAFINTTASGLHIELYFVNGKRLDKTQYDKVVLTHRL